MKRLIPVIIAATLGSAAFAQEAYVGAGVDYHFPHSGDAQTVTSGIAGLGFDTGLFGIGAEAEYGLRVAGDNDYDTARVRVWVSRDWADYTFRFAGGVTEYYFEDDNAGGFNFGLGAEREVSPNLTVRGELIRDFMDNIFTDAVTTTRIAVLYNF
ncbi:outer membrane protein [Roseobacter sp. CCS2]|uniref:outer membrane protein n=1 Tax=Roseobacter sp. CCS2 TaxID=391593 RepID=UPI0000F3E3EA|nr:hypothetical protein [Roseobacter sp. CCS2]EBA12472.1 hypothetical protein RCCS2_14284 [Roseobacter sp. CCS2]